MHEAGGCLGGRVCGDEGYCVEAAGCGGDSDCIGERRCLLSECRTVRCESHEECPGNEKCVNWAAKPTSGACDCPVGASCNDGHCELPGPCGDAINCPQGECLDSGLCSEARRMQIVPARPDAWMGFARRLLNALRMPDTGAGYVCLEASAQESLTVEMTGLKAMTFRRQRFRSACSRCKDSDCAMESMIGSLCDRRPGRDHPPIWKHSPTPSPDVFHIDDQRHP